MMMKQSMHKIIADSKLLPTYAPRLMDKAYSELHLGCYKKADAFYLKAVKHSATKVDPHIYDVLAEVIHCLILQDELIKYAGLALESKKL